MRRRERRAKEAAFVAVGAALAGLGGCRYILGITDRTEAIAIGDSGMPGPDTAFEFDADNDAGAGMEYTCVPPCTPRSCLPPDGGDAAAFGAGHNCGPDAGDDCCATIAIEGGSFVADNCEEADSGCDAGLSVVSPFYLDKYEVSVARFERFVLDGYGQFNNPPVSGSGSNSSVINSGWIGMSAQGGTGTQGWNGELEQNTSQLENDLGACGLGTWGGSPANLPITCANWYEAFAFCIYDGGRLPTELEWTFAASGGAAQNVYPWGSADPSGPDAGEAGPYANFCDNGTFDGGAQTPPIDGFFCSENNNAMPVGTLSPRGDGLFGNADLAGNAFEFVFDWWTPNPFPCKNNGGGNANCAVVTAPSDTTGGVTKVVRGGAWRAGKTALLNAARYPVNPTNRGLLGEVGFRCARNAKSG